MKEINTFISEHTGCARCRTVCFSHQKVCAKQGSEFFAENALLPKYSEKSNVPSCCATRPARFAMARVGRREKPRRMISASAPTLSSLSRPSSLRGRQALPSWSTCSAVWSARSCGNCSRMFVTVISSSTKTQRRRMWLLSKAPALADPDAIAHGSAKHDPWHTKKGDFYKNHQPFREAELGPVGSHPPSDSSHHGRHQ